MVRSREFTDDPEIQNPLKRALDFIDEAIEGDAPTILHLPQGEAEVAMVAGILVGACHVLTRSDDPVHIDACEVLRDHAYAIAKVSRLIRKGEN